MCCQDTFSIDSMKAGLNNAVFVSLGAARHLSQLDLLDKNFDYSAHKRLITGNMKRVDEYSSLVFLSIFM